MIAESTIIKNKQKTDRPTTQPILGYLSKKTADKNYMKNNVQ
jgi:hypothetical protein